jgi:hypothetical protein
MSRFTDTMIRAVVEQAQLSNSDGAAYLGDVIIKRRDKTVRWGITATNPLDRFEVRGGPSPELAFDNIAVRLGYAQGARYTVRWAAFDNHTGTTSAAQPPIDADAMRTPVPADIWGPPDAAGIRYAVASLATDHPLFRHWAKPVVVTIRNRNGVFDIVGIDRPTEFPDTKTRQASE